MRILPALVLLCSFSLAHADDAPYQVSVAAKQVRSHDAQPDTLTVETRISENKKDGAVISAPRVSLLDGQQANISVGEERRDAGGHPGPLHSGLKVDITKPVGKDQVLVVITIFKDGKVTWSDAQWANVEPAAKP